MLGKFELGAPSISTFVLHGTLPVPQGTYPRADGLQPFGVISGDGQIVPAQCEIVSRFPNDTKGADVVEILARVTLPPGTQPGTRVTYSIVDFPHAATTMTSTPAVAGLMNTPGAVTLRTHDVFSNEYRADLLRGQDGSEVLRMGSAAFQTRFYETMRPTGGVVGPPSGPLPHFLNAHSYVTEWLGEDMLSIDLRVHNAPSGKDQSSTIDNPLETVYFENLELWVPNGWTVLVDWRDPALGTPRQEPGFTVLPLIKDNPDGTMHMMPGQAQLQRRMVLVKQGRQTHGTSVINEEWLGFCRRGTNAQGVELYSWWNPSTAYYFPQRHLLPRLDHLGLPLVRAKLTIDLHRISDCLVRGTTNGGAITTPNLGWAHPWGVKYGGMTSGTEIYLYDGMQTADAASADGYRLSQLALRMYAERNPTSLYNRDGNPTQYTDWITHGAQFDYIYMQFYLRLLPGNDPFGFDQAPTYQQSYVASHALAPAYESELLAFKPIDIQHQVRITRSMKVLTWLGNDAMAKDDLRMHAEIVRLSYHDMPSSPGGGVMGTGMLVDLTDVGVHSGVGFDFGRGEGWSIDTMCAAYSINSVAWRQQARGWFDEIVTLVRDGQATCTGTIQRNYSDKLLDGLYYGRQSIEQAIIENALWGMMQSVYKGVSPTSASTLRTVIAKSAYSMVQFPAWDNPKKGPWAQLAVAPLSLLGLPFCNLIPPLGTSAGVDKFQVWSSFAYGYELTGDQIFLDKALMMAGGTNLLTTLENSNYTNMENRAALIALVQTLP
ncbi:MAG TPA: hypothetical protein VK843_01715 [Planctomycetota bacterium]|nr:hypothetical protein [Planctomycetota bacterium]